MAEGLQKRSISIQGSAADAEKGIWRPSMGRESITRKGGHPVELRDPKGDIEVDTTQTFDDDGHTLRTGDFQP